MPNPATKEEGSQTVAEDQTTSTSEADVGQEDVSDVSEDDGNISHQDEPMPVSDELENQEETEEEQDVAVSRDENLVENSVERESSYQVRWKRKD